MELDLVADRLERDLEGLVPDGGLASITADLGPLLDAVIVDEEVGVHLAKEVHVVGQLG